MSLPVVGSGTAGGSCGCGGGSEAPSVDVSTGNTAGGGCGCGSGPQPPSASSPASEPAGSGCHGGAERLDAAARAAGKGEVMDDLLADYPQGPHDQPQGMCPAFGSLRVGLRMRRTATILSGSACCVYGLTFTSHFYGARRTVGYVPFNSETLVTGALFEDIKQAIEDLADPEKYDAIVMTNLCIPTASGVPLDLLPDTVNGVRVVGIDVPGFGVPTHAEAKDVLSGALLKFARSEAQAGPVARPRDPTKLEDERPAVTLLGELFPADPMGIDALLAPMGARVGVTVPTREWRELYQALDAPVAAAIHPFYTRAVRQLQAAGRTVIPSGPVGAQGTEAWLSAVGEALGLPAATVGAAVDGAVAACQAGLESRPLDGRINVSGYEGSELLVARLLVEAGADVPYVGTALPRTPWSDPDREWLEAHGVQIQYRASLEQDVAAFRASDPDLVLGTTPVVQQAKEDGIPALYFTNLISARPIFGPAGAASLADTLLTAMDGGKRLNRMRSFFEGVGTGHAAGYGFDGVPEKKLSARERNARARGGKAVTGKTAGTKAAASSPADDGSSKDGSEDPSGRSGARIRATTDRESRIRRSAAAKGSLVLTAAPADTGDAGGEPTEASASADAGHGEEV